MVHIEILGAVGVVVTISSINETDVSAAAQCSLERTEVNTGCTVVVKADNINVVSATHRLRANSSTHSDSFTVTDCPVACARAVCRNTRNSFPSVFVQNFCDKCRCNLNRFICRGAIIFTSGTAYSDNCSTSGISHTRHSNCRSASRDRGNARRTGSHAQCAIIVAANCECCAFCRRVQCNARRRYSQRTGCLANRPRDILGGSRSIRPAIVSLWRERSSITTCVRAGSRATKRHISRVVIAPAWRLRGLIVGQCTALGGHIRNRDTVCCTGRPLRRRGVDAAVRGLWEEGNVILRSVRQTGNR